MPLREIDPTGKILWRIGRYPDPLAWIPREFLGDGRFDDPRAEFLVMYVAEQRATCFVETLAAFRPRLPLLSALAQMTQDTAANVATADARMPRDWLLTRRIGWLEPAPDLHVLDLRAVETREGLRSVLAPLLIARGYDDFDLGVALNQDRSLTQGISRWAYEHGYRGMAYTSRFGAEFDCWVLFSVSSGTASQGPAPFTPLGTSGIQQDDPDLLAAMRLFGLRW